MVTSAVTQKLDVFFTQYTKLTYHPREVVLRAGDPPPGIYYLKEGFVRQYYISPAGDTLVMHLFKPGSFFPMTFAVNQTPNTYYYETVTPVVVWRAPVEVVRAFLAKEPEVLFSFTERLLLGLSGLLKRMEGFIFDSAYEKIVLLIVYLATSVGEKKAGGGISIPFPLTHREIAAWVGATRETASLQMEVLKKKGFITYTRSAISIKNINALLKEAVK